MVIKFVVYGEPVGKGRPKFARQGAYVRTYTPEKTANYETLIKWEYASQCAGLKMADDANVEATIDAFFTIPKSASKKRADQMRDGTIRPTKKPDCDNVVKSVLDAINGIAYRDDSQVVKCTINKYYSDSPRVMVTLRDL